jgi:chemotaxis response regulator CheB
VRALKEAIPLWSIAQNAQTCAVYGMPQAVVQAGLDDECLALGDIAPRLNKLFRVP